MRRVAIATRSLRPEAIIENGRTGWLVEPDDEAALAAALVEAVTLVEAVNHTRERERRGEAARLAVREQYSWRGIAAQLATVLEDVVDEGKGESYSIRAAARGLCAGGRG